MIDERFYDILGPAALRELFADSEIRGDASRMVRAPASLDAAGPDDLAYFEGKADEPVRTAAGALIIAPQHADRAPATAALVLAKRPRAAFAAAARKLAREKPFQTDAAIASSAQLEPGAIIAPGVVIGPGAQIGAGAEIGPNAVIGPGVSIGRRSRIGPNAVITFALVGDDVTILGGSVVGQSGFGVAAGEAGLVDVPHFGRAVIQDRVTLGSCVTVDRGVFADTVVSEDAKIDNLSQIAHNVVIGRGVMMAAFAGISGSCRIEDGALLGGRVGLADHLHVGQGAAIAAGAGVLEDVPAGARWGGYPAKPLRRWVRELSWLAKAAAGKRDGGE